MSIRLFVWLLFTLVSLTSFAQLRVSTQTDAEKQAVYRERIGLDYSMPNYSVKKIDEAKMGTRLANILRYFEESMNQGQYNRWLATILGEQHEELRTLYFYVKKIKLLSVSKKGNEIIITYKVWPENNPAKVKQAEVQFLFKEGVSDSQTTNELFSTMSRYVQAREKLNK